VCEDTCARHLQQAKPLHRRGCRSRMLLMLDTLSRWAQHLPLHIPFLSLFLSLLDKKRGGPTCARRMYSASFSAYRTLTSTSARVSTSFSDTMRCSCMRVWACQRVCVCHGVTVQMHMCGCVRACSSALTGEGLGRHALLKAEVHLSSCTSACMCTSCLGTMCGCMSGCACLGACAW